VSNAAAPVIVILGDSLTAGLGLSSSEAYPALLQQRARAAGYTHRIVNAGISGDTTTDALNRFERALVADTRILVVALGANDGLRGHPTETVTANLRRIIEAAKSRDVRVLLCGMDTPPSHGWDYSIRFHNIFPDLAREYEVPLMPFLLAGVVGDDRLNLPDRFHPNAAGMRVIANEMWPYLEPLLKTTSSTPR
jgi:acyl-CoA thioesterase-1